VLTLHIDTGREMRGGQWQALYLLLGLTERGHRVRLLAPVGSPLLQAALAQRLDARPLRVRELAGAWSGADLIHAHDARAHAVAVLLARPVVVSRRVAFPVQEGWASRWKYRRAAHFIAVSHYVKKTLVDAGVDPERISIVYDGVPIPAAPAITEERLRVLALDSDDPGKGKKIVEEAAGLAGWPVAFTSNLSRDLPGAALFVYITELEGLGSAALLAMANRVPVIASNVGGLPEIVVDGVTGLLTSNQPLTIARHIQRLLADRPLAKLLAAQAAARVEQEFSIQRLVNETLRVYEKIIS
jgi:glycosyltransferase involved in cell wall biosynthesis